MVISSSIQSENLAGGLYIVGSDGEIIYCHERAHQKDLSAVIEKYFKQKGS
jgi:hypothetical protein